MMGRLKTDADLLAETGVSRVLDPALAARVVTIVHPRARRLTLRVDVGQGQIVLVRPRRARTVTVLEFVASRRDWIAQALATLPPRIGFEDGAVIPVSGTQHTLCFASEKRGGVWREGNMIVVAGQHEHAARRLRDWLKEEFRRTLTPVVREMATLIDCRVGRLGVRDTVSRWGSCSPEGRLSFSWRLIFAPPAVALYVAAHEVAHLKHMNHSRAFWRTVEQILDTYLVEPNARREAGLARQWLSRSGATLHRYG